MNPCLILCAHGTRDPRGQAVILTVARQVQDFIGCEVRVAYVDVQSPTIDEVVAEIEPRPAGELAAIVVPYLLAAGYHVHVDIARAVTGRADVVATAALGPDPRLAQIVVDRLGQAGVSPASTVVLAPAGSSNPRAQADALATLELVRRAWPATVRIGYAAGTSPKVADAVQAARADGAEVAVASYLLGPGVFQTLLRTAGADVVTAPLAPDQRILDIIAERYRSAAALPEPELMPEPIV